MKHTYPLVLILTLILSACSKPAEKEETTAQDLPEIAQPKAAQDTESSPTNYQPSLLKTIQGADQITELKHNLQAIQTAKSNIASITSAISSETDTAKKAELQNALETEEAKISVYNEKMLQAYDIDFEGSDEYIFTPQKAQIFVQMTTEEIAQRKEQDPNYAGGEMAFALTKELVTPQLIQQFQRDLSLIKQMRQEIVQMQQTLPTLTEEDAKTELEAAIKEATNRLIENDKNMFDAYGHTSQRPSQVNYVEMNVYSQPKLPELNEIAGLADDYVLIGTLKGAELNREFQRNVQTMQSLRNDLLTLRQQFNAETDEDKQAQLREQFEVLSDKTNENNQQMVEAYKYSLDRNYSQVTKKARVYIQLSEEDIAKKIELDPEYIAPEDGYEELLTIKTVKANQDFQNNVQLMQSLRNKIIQAKQALELETDEAKQAERQAQIDAATAKLIENNKRMTKAYRYSLNRNYQYIIEESDLYLQLSREEISALEAAE